MTGLTQEVQIRLGIEVEDETILVGLLPEDDGASHDLEQAIVNVLTTALDSPDFRELLCTYGLAIRRGEVRAFTQQIAMVLPGSGLVHPVAHVVDQHAM
ncbi:hypothetical protein LQ757_14770 [Agromyces sp. SYSU K20354]|uniref:hypothetical protein n=1 Tax=Agromyces cavernae TaxID=2898659 RepID=UPI001E4C9C6A|nr:hypothetical protein [Agromyces cavernae]MCD2443542.1 hypothetical protein [Agromyces cavernae]